MQFFIRYNPFKTWKNKKCFNATIEAESKEEAIEKFKKQYLNIYLLHPDCIVDCVRLQEDRIK